MARAEHEFYVSNIKLYEEYQQWYADLKSAEEENIDEPEVPAFIVDAMIRIAHRLSYKPNFINYSFKEEMISDALFDCVRYAKKFTLEISKTSCSGCKVSNCKNRIFDKGCIRKSNPFSYITTICFRAFLRRIDAEKKQTYIKGKIISDFPMSEFLDTQANEDDTQFVNQYIEFMREVGCSDDAIPMSIKRGNKKKEIVIEIEDIEINLENLDE